MSQRFEGLTVKQTEVLGQVAVNNDGGHHLRTLESLVNRGYLTTLRERFQYGHIIHYDVPVAVHMRWSAWCATLPENATEAQ